MQYFRTFYTAFILNVNLYYFCYRYLYKYQEAMPVEQVVKSICNYKQAYTQYGGLRPFGVAFLFAGWDRNFGFQLYQTDPSGNYSGWKATVIGAACISSYKQTNKYARIQMYSCHTYCYTRNHIIIIHRSCILEKKTHNQVRITRLGRVF